MSLYTLVHRKPLTPSQRNSGALDLACLLNVTNSLLWRAILSIKTSLFFPSPGQHSTSFSWVELLQIVKSTMLYNWIIFYLELTSCLQAIMVTCSLALQFKCPLRRIFQSLPSEVRLAVQVEWFMLLFLFYAYFKMALKTNPQLNNAKCPQSGTDSCVKYSWKPCIPWHKWQSKIAKSPANSPGIGVWGFPLTSALQSPKY